MGNLMESQLCEEDCHELIDKNITKKGTVNIQQFGSVPLYMNEITNQYFFSHECEFLIPSDEELSKSLETLKKLNNSCPSLIRIWKITSKRQMANCHGRNKLVVYFQYLPISLKGVISSRKTPFPEPQVYKLFNSLLMAVKHLNSKQSYHGDITPEFIYFDQKAVHKQDICNSGRYKIFDPVYFTPMRSGYYRAQSEPVYCAPEILANLNEKRIYPLYNHYICDTFSIGLVVLYSMTLIDPMVAYHNSKQEIDYYYIQSLLRVALKHNYSERLIKCLRECLLIKNRPTVSEVLQNYQFLNIDFQNESFKYSLKKI